MQEKAARQAAKRLFKKYNFQGGVLSNYQLSCMMDQTYQILNIPFKPSTKDVKNYQKILDIDQDGKVSLSDLQLFAIQSLCRGGIQLTQYPTQNTTNYTFNLKKNYNEQPMQNYSGQSYTSIYTQTKNTPRSYFRQTQNYQPHSQLAGYQYQSHYTQSGASQNLNQQLSQQNQNGQKPYSQLVKEYLGVVGQVFMKYADPQTYSVTQNQVGYLLSDTYAVLGREGYDPSQDDILAWMKLCDVNNDGRVEFQQYEFFVVKSLQRSGMNLYDD